MLRGGGFYIQPMFVRAAFRLYFFLPDSRGLFGFRLARTYDLSRGVKKLERPFATVFSAVAGGYRR